MLKFTGASRFNFLIESMWDLSNSLSACNHATKLHVVRGAPQTVLPVLWKAWNITHLIFEKDTAGYGAIRDAEIRVLAANTGINVTDVLGHTLYDPVAIVNAHGGKATMSATAWHAVCLPHSNPSYGILNNRGRRRKNCQNRRDPFPLPINSRHPEIHLSQISRGLITQSIAPSI